MIKLTRLRHGQTFLLNPDHIERVDSHVESVVHLSDGTEYVVVEQADEIVQRIIEFRARILAVASILQTGPFDAGRNGSTPARAYHELDAAPGTDRADDAADAHIDDDHADTADDVADELIEEVGR